MAEVSHKKTRYELWKEDCVRAAESLGLAVGDMWEANDPYDLTKLALEAFNNKRSAASFIEEVFDEDLARMENDDQEYADSLEHNFGGGDDDEW